MDNNQLATDINSFHRIILSMYYNSNDFAPGKYKQNNSLDMDLMELLLMMEGIFDEVHYKMCTDNQIQMTTVDAAEGKKELYADKISKDEYLKRYKVLDVKPLEHYCDKDFQSVKHIDTIRQAPANLYFHNLLITHINNTCRVSDRRVLMHYLLFNNQDETEGRMFIIYLKSRLVELVERISDTDKYGDPRLLATSMKADHEALIELFAQKDRKIEDLKRRTWAIRENINKLVDKEYCFEHEASVVDYWINDHSSEQIHSFAEFIFMRAKGYKKIALALIEQIVKIYTTTVVQNDDLKSWLDDVPMNRNLYALKEMTNVDKKLYELELRAGADDFKYDIWGKEYLKELDKALKTLGFAC